MTEAPPPSDTIDEVALAVRNLMPGLKKQALVATVIMATAGFAGAVGTAMILSSRMDGQDRFKATLVAIGVAITVMVVANRWMHSKQEALVMPVLARSIGLIYSKDAKAFVQNLPKRLLPERGLRGGEDHVHGKLGAHTIQMAEVQVETGGKNSRILFKGIVAQFPNRIVMPAFFLAMEDKTRPGLFFGGDLSTEGLRHLRTVGMGDTTYGIWVSQTSAKEPPALSAVISVLTGLEGQIGYGTKLYAATSNGEEMHVAHSHSRDLFRVGGFFPNEDALFTSVQTAMQDLKVPLALAKTLIAAEEAAAPQ